MAIKRTAADWEPDKIRRFWDWYSPRPETQRQYFSRQVGPALANLLEMAGGLKGRVLDFGCGPGYLLEQLCRRGHARCEGVDFSARSVAEATARLDGKPAFAGARCVSGIPTDLPADTFDGLTCIETIEHLPEAGQKPLLAEVNRLLKPGGVALFTTPCSENLEAAQMYCPFCDSEFHNMQHMRAIAPADLAVALREVGFEVLFCDGIDLLQYQRLKARGILRTSLKDVLAMAARLALRVGDVFGSKGPFPASRAFRARRRPGPHLVAIARKPAGS